MKTKLILSAVVAASIALSSSVFAANDANSPSGKPSGKQLVELFKTYCASKDNGSALQKMLSNSAGVTVSTRQAMKICQAIREHNDD